MSISEPFIRRPIATSLLMAGVLLIGLLGYFFLPVSALPPVDFLFIQVSAHYPGACPHVMASSLTPPLERQFGQHTVLAQKLSEVSGVGLVTIEGNQKPAVRVRINPSVLAGLGLGFEDIRTALIQNNINAPKGSFDGPRQSYAIGANDQIYSAADYG